MPRTEMKTTILVALALFLLPAGTFAQQPDGFFDETEPTKSYTESDQAKAELPEMDSVKLFTEGLVAPLTTGALAPFEGYLLDVDSLANIFSDREALLLSFELTLKTQRELDLAQLNLETGNLRLRLEADHRKSNVLLEGKNKEVIRLRKINKDLQEDRSNLLRDIVLAGGGVGVGILLGFLIAGAAGL